MNELPGESMDVGQPPKLRKKGHKLRNALIVIGVLISLILYGAGPGINNWAKSNQRQLQSELDAIAARGEPITWAGLQPEPVPDDQNAALLYKQAFTYPIVSGEDEETQRLQRIAKEFKKDFWIRTSYREDVAEILRQAQPAIELCRRARPLSREDWGCDYSQPAVEMDFVQFKDVDFMSAVLSLSALEAHDDGDDEKALGYLLDNQRLSISLYSERFIIPYLLSCKCSYRTFSVLENIVPTLDITAGSAGREQADIVLANLTDESVVSQALINALIGERCFLLDIADQIKRDEIFAEEIEKPSTRLVRWVIAFNELILVRNATLNIEAFKFDTCPSAIKALPEPVPEYTDPIRSRIYFLAIGLQYDSMDQTCEFHFRNIAERRMAATALAMRMYEVDHGARPESLEQLVPDYLPAVPDDPFFDGKRKISYAPDTDKPVLYSVWLDGEDDGGQYTTYADGDGVDIDESPDLVFFLNGDRPTKTPAPNEAQTQPVSAEVD